MAFFWIWLAVALILAVIGVYLCGLYHDEDGVLPAVFLSAIWPISFMCFLVFVVFWAPYALGTGELQAKVREWRKGKKP